MSFLLPYNLSKNTRNKYLYYFYKSLKNEEINIISSTASWINKSPGYEAVIIHWPEYLPGKNRKSEFEFLNFTIDRLNHFKKVSKIIYFVHNAYLVSVLEWNFTKWVKENRAVTKEIIKISKSNY